MTQRKELFFPWYLVQVQQPRPDKSFPVLITWCTNWLIVSKATPPTWQGESGVSFWFHVTARCHTSNHSVVIACSLLAVRIICYALLTLDMPKISTPFSSINAFRLSTFKFAEWWGIPLIFWKTIRKVLGCFLGILDILVVCAWVEGCWLYSGKTKILGDVDECFSEFCWYGREDVCEDRWRCSCTWTCVVAKLQGFPIGEDV